MQALLAPLQELADFDRIREFITGKPGKNDDGVLSLSGCVDSQKLHMIYGLSEGLKYKVIVTYSDARAREICEEYKFYDKNVMLYPGKDLIFFQADIHGNQLTRERVKLLVRYNLRSLRCTCKSFASSANSLPLTVLPLASVAT